MAVVVIGRNEGARLQLCIKSTSGLVANVVYVDSGSIDGSAEWASSEGVRVVDLDMSQPFTAARARNAGAAEVHNTNADIRYLQFIDGDCELAPMWLAQAHAFLEVNTSVVAVCGRLRERYPSRSIYNRMCDFEWDTPVGPARYFGGIVMIRAEGFREVGGFLEGLIAGEEPELAIRLRNAGGSIWRLELEMAWHDAAITQFCQWWRRAVRGGYAYALGASIHGGTPERHWVRESRSAWLWGLVIPLGAATALMIGQHGLALAIAMAYPFQWIRLVLAAEGPIRMRQARATFLILGKFAEVTGQLKFSWHRLTGRTGRLIEYK